MATQRTERHAGACGYAGLEGFSVPKLPRPQHYADRPGYPGHGPVYQLDWHRTADDRAVEALLACVGEPCTAQQLAYGLGWTLNRTVDALQRLEASLANTGQILTRLGHHSYTLGPRPGLLNDREIARCLRHDSQPLNLTAAAVRAPPERRPLR